jgi:hypothetical protein
MSENDDNGRDLEDAAAEGRLPGVEAADAAEEDGRDPSGTEDALTDGQATGDTSTDGQTDDDAAAGGVVMGAINQH